MARRALEPAPGSSTLSALRARLDRGRDAVRLPRLALAAAAGVSFVAMSLMLAGRGRDVPTPAPGTIARSADGARVPSPARRAPSAAIAPRYVLDIAPAGNGLRYVVHSPRGETAGALDLGPHYVLDTVPTNAVVVDTF